MRGRFRCGGRDRALHFAAVFLESHEEPDVAVGIALVAAFGLTEELHDAELVERHGDCKAGAEDVGGEGVFGGGDLAAELGGFVIDESGFHELAAEAAPMVADDVEDEEFFEFVFGM